LPDAILLKPGRLTEEEYAAIKRHTLIGEGMGRDVPFLPDSTRQLNRSHHERWDGAGYPDGLAGDAVPLKARTFAIVVVYGALTGERPYPHAWSRDEAVAELERQSVAQFGPELDGWRAIEPGCSRSAVQSLEAGLQTGDGVVSRFLG
jgi:HD-GYP domain-containing protein (c-di-GMP phosphodiesterase class II)